MLTVQFTPISIQFSTVNNALCTVYFREWYNEELYNSWSVSWEQFAGSVSQFLIPGVLRQKLPSVSHHLFDAFQKSQQDHWTGLHAGIVSLQSVGTVLQPFQHPQVDDGKECVS